MGTPRNITIIRPKAPVLGFVTESNGTVRVFSAIDTYNVRRQIVQMYDIDPNVIHTYDRTRWDTASEMLAKAWKAGAKVLGLDYKNTVKSQDQATENQSSFQN